MIYFWENKFAYNYLQLHIDNPTRSRPIQNMDIVRKETVLITNESKLYIKT